jgi:hypothetical protein
MVRSPKDSRCPSLPRASIKTVTGIASFRKSTVFCREYLLISRSGMLMRTFAFKEKNRLAFPRKIIRGIAEFRLPVRRYFATIASEKRLSEQSGIPGIWLLRFPTGITLS